MVLTRAARAGRAHRGVPPLALGQHPPHHALCCRRLGRHLLVPGRPPRVVVVVRGCFLAAPVASLYNVVPPSYWLTRTEGMVQRRCSSTW
jgi:hypothetical protein